MTRSARSRSALMTHAAAGDDSDWSVEWNKHRFGARRALIGRCGRLSVQTGLRRLAANRGSGSWSRTGAERQRSPP